MGRLCLRRCGVRRIHELYELLLQCLERSAVCLVFCNGYEAQLLPEARVTICEGLEVRDALGELEGGELDRKSS